MQEVLPGLPGTATEQQRIKLDTERERRRASLLKFYIHDSASYFRLELIGELTENDIAELAGCWRTAKSSIAGRKLALDVRQLKAVDQAGRQWLSSMVREGACYITGKNRFGAYLVCPDWRPGDPDSDPGNCGPKLLQTLVRILSFLRQCVAGMDARSQTNTVNADSVRVTGL
jgi:hypothetical protein